MGLSLLVSQWPCWVHGCQRAQYVSSALSFQTPIHFTCLLSTFQMYSLQPSWTAGTRRSKCYWTRSPAGKPGKPGDEVHALPAVDGNWKLQPPAEEENWTSVDRSHQLVPAETFWRWVMFILLLPEVRSWADRCNSVTMSPWKGNLASMDL